MHDPDVVFGELKLTAGDLFLDLGCGPGDYAIHASRLVGESGAVLAVDGSEANITEITRRAGEDGLENIRAVTSDITGRLPVDDACVDVCLLATVLHIPYVTERAGGLCNEIRRVLKPGGRLVIIDCHKESLPFGPPVHMRLSSEEVKEMMERCGFGFSGGVDLGYNYLLRFTP
jgi:ubiquinone/menaquinone biosynthesis C-methylase UbiE